MTKVTTIYMRQNPRFPKIIALGVLLDHLRKQGCPTPTIEMIPVDQQRLDNGIYQLDCGPNEYRKRGKASELAVVMTDFNIPSDEVLENLIDDLSMHNHGGGNNRPHFFMNNAWGSAAWFTGSAWPLIESVPQSHWRWSTEAVEGTEGLVLDNTGRPEFRRGNKASALTANDFLGMCVDVVAVFLLSQRLKAEGKLRSWGDGEKLKTMKAILDAKFIGSDLRDRRVRTGNYMFPTMSGYVRDLWITGSGVDEIRKRLRPWLRLWDVAGTCYIDADGLEPTWLKLRNASYGVAFDLTQYKNVASDGNPLIHQRWLAKEDKANDDERFDLVIVRRETGHTAIIFRNKHEKKATRLWEALEYLEPGRWHLQGLGVYNGSSSRTEIAPSKILFSQGSISLTGLATNVVNQEYEFAHGRFDAQFVGASRNMFDK